jgi:hypothetical protein
MDEFVLAVQVVAACVYGASAASKLRSGKAYRVFRAGLGQTGVVPPRGLSAVAAVLTTGEAVIAVAMTAAGTALVFSAQAARTLTVTSLTACLLLTAVLVGGVAAVIRRGTSVRCACFGSSETGPPLGMAHLLRNASLLALVIAGLADGMLASQPSAHSVTAGSFAVAVAAGLVCAMFLIRWEDVAYLVAPATAVRGTSRARVRATSR